MASNDTKDVLSMLTTWLDTIVEKEKAMHSRIQSLMANKARRFCKQIADLEFYKSGRLFVKARGDTLMTIRSLGLESMRPGPDPECRICSPRLMLSKISRINRETTRDQTGKDDTKAAAAQEAAAAKETAAVKEAAAAKVAAAATSPKKTRRKKSLLGAARKMRMTNRIVKNKTRKKFVFEKKDVSLLQNMELFGQFMKVMENGEAQDEAAQEADAWQQSPLNTRVAALEHAGRQAPNIDEKLLIKAIDPEEYGMFEEQRVEAKSFSQDVGGQHDQTAVSSELGSSTKSVGKRKKHKKRRRPSGVDRTQEEIMRAAAAYVDSKK